MFFYTQNALSPVVFIVTPSLGSVDSNCIISIFILTVSKNMLYKFIIIRYWPKSLECCISFPREYIMLRRKQKRISKPESNFIYFRADLNNYYFVFFFLITILCILLYWVVQNLKFVSFRTFLLFHCIFDSSNIVCHQSSFCF